MRKTQHGTEWPRRIARSVAVAATILLASAGCQQEILTPDIISPDNLSGKDALPTIRDAALGDFALAYSGSGADGSSGTEGIITASGLLADEFVNSETFPTRIEIDRRSTQLNNSSLTGWFRTQMRARRSTEFAAAKYRQLSPDTTGESGFPEMLALSGFAYLFFAENYCSGVPISTANNDGSLTFGPPLTTANLIDSAVSRFTQALNAANALNGTISAATKTARINLAKVGMGRALLDKAVTVADFQAAATAVSGVLTSFNYVIFHSQNTTRQNNGVFVAMAIAKRYAVPVGSEGINGLNFRAAFVAGDGRVPTAQTGVGFDGATPQWNQLRFADRTTANPLATGAEARLIEAEAFLVANDTTNFKATHNALRAAPPSYFNQPAPAAPITPLGPLPVITALTPTQLQNLHFQEREFWLWNSAHRLGDLRRLSRVALYGPRGTETVFPTGNYFKGGTYGTDVNFPVPFDETNNPLFSQCINRNP